MLVEGLFLFRRGIEEGIGCPNFKIGQSNTLDDHDRTSANFEIWTPDPVSSYVA